LLEILYLSIAIVTGYQAQLLLRRAGPGPRPYAYLLLGDGALAAFAFLGSQSPEATYTTELVGAAAIFFFVGLVLVPPILRDLTRRALGRERLGLALSLTRLREALTPGLGAHQERELIEVIRAVRAGDVDGALASLRARRAATDDPRQRHALDERLIFTLLSASRWDEATREYERARDAGGPASVALAVEMIRAYGEVGDLERAAEIVTWTEGLGSGPEPALAYFVARARLLFLAYAGRARGVERALAARGPLSSMPEAAAAYWIGTARSFAGDRDGAREILARAASLSRRDARGRALAEERLAGAGRAPAVLAPEIEGVADRVERAAVAEASQPLTLSGRGTAATVGLMIANVCVHVLVTWRLGSTEDPWVLARAGANLKAAILAGEPWRLLTSTFLHVGALHLALNLLGLWSLGRFIEPAFGWVRFTAVYALAGLGGSLASLLLGPPGMSAGASGAVFGILGAAIAELALVRRRTIAPAWRRAILGNLVFVAVANVAIGALYPVIDQAAHVGGMVSGGLAALLLSPNWWSAGRRATAVLAGVLAAAYLAACGLGAVMVARTTYGETLARLGWQRHDFEAVSLDLPRGWVILEPGAAHDPISPLEPTLTVEVTAPEEAAGLLPRLVESLEGKATDVVEVPSTVAPPPGWRAVELRFGFVAAGRPGTYRRAVYTRDEGEVTIALTLLFDEARAADARALAPRILESVHLGPGP
jgi:membrane associated rhomboid family serine protease